MTSSDLLYNMLLIMIMRLEACEAVRRTSVEYQLLQFEVYMYVVYFLQFELINLDCIYLFLEYKH
jgi:hypothetical protein